MKSIIEKMQLTLNREKPPRLTALRGLQLEETGDPFKILIGTILSARTRDENTTRVVRKFFERFQTPKDVASADIDIIKRIIHSIGFYNVKAERIKRVSTILVERYAGKVPSEIDELLQLPGVGRKTANCVLVYAFDKPAIPVDIHVHRISNRLGLVKTRTPEQTEMELVRNVDENLWNKVNDTFVMYGQNICLPVKPRCGMCDLKMSCRYYRSSRKAFAS
jgi:endonuclease III